MLGDISKAETQYDLHHIAGARSLRLDVLGTDSKGRQINLEVQRADAGACRNIHRLSPD